MRDDVARPGIGREAALANAPLREGALPARAGRPRGRALGPMDRNAPARRPHHHRGRGAAPPPRGQLPRADGGVPGPHRARRGAAEHASWRSARSGRWPRPTPRTPRSPRRRGGRPAAGHPVRAEGHLRHPRAGRRRPAATAGCRPPPARASWRAIARHTLGDAEERLTSGGRGAARQDELRRVRHGLSNENSAYGPVRNPGTSRPCPGGSSRRLVGRRGGRAGVLRARHRHRRQHPPAGLADRESSA